MPLPPAPGPGPQPAGVGTQAQQQVDEDYQQQQQQYVQLQQDDQRHVHGLQQGDHLAHAQPTSGNNSISSIEHLNEKATTFEVSKSQLQKSQQQIEHQNHDHSSRNDAAVEQQQQHATELSTSPLQCFSSDEKDYEMNSSVEQHDSARGLR